MVGADTAEEDTRAAWGAAAWGAAPGAEGAVASAEEAEAWEAEACPEAVVFLGGEWEAGPRAWGARSGAACPVEEACLAVACRAAAWEEDCLVVDWDRPDCPHHAAVPPVQSVPRAPDWGGPFRGEFRVGAGRPWAGHLKLAVGQRRAPGLPEEA